MSTVTSKHTAEHYTWGAACDGWHLIQQPHLSVIHERMPPGAAEVRHLHSAALQFFFILSGTAMMELAGRTETLRAFQGIEIAPGIPHQIRNESADDVEFLVISQPPAQGDRIAAPLEG